MWKTSPTVLFGAVLAICGACRPAPPTVVPDTDLAARAVALAHDTVLVDTHIDLPYRLEGVWRDVTVETPDGHFDAARARRGGLDAAFMSIYVPSELGEGEAARAHAEEAIDLVEELARRDPDVFALARTPDEVLAAARRGLIALPMGMENGAAFGHDLAAVAHFFDRGIRYVTLTHAENNQLSDSSYADGDRWGGLSPFGREVVAEMNRLGMMVDVSHLSDEATAEAIAVSRAPVIASHSSARAFTPGWERNISDDLVEALAAKGGVVQVNFGSAFVTSAANRASSEAREAAARFAAEEGLADDAPEVEAFTARWREEHPRPEVMVADVADHFDHIVDLVGVEHVGIGSDFDGVGSLPVGLDSAADYPNLFAELLRRGYSEADVRRIAGENLLRVWREVERVAARSGAGDGGDPGSGG